MAHQKKQNIHYSPASEPVIVYADARRLKQILVNLLGNAIKFTPNEGALGLEVQANKSEGNVRLTVWDKGIGIRSEDLHKLFKPFVQIDSSLAREYSGTGLGLSLVKRLTEMHHGGVEVESVVGEGSRFTIVLPLIQDGAPIPKKTQHDTGNLSGSALSYKSSQFPLVMIADDSETILQMMADFLEAQQFQVIKTHSGLELIERAAELHPNVMLVDVQMPGMDGLETIRRIRANKDAQVAVTPIIAVTALAMTGDHERCLEAGANEYMSKPIKLTELAKITQKLIQEKRA
jgi:CheY-like chemotaxis protein